MPRTEETDAKVPELRESVFWELPGPVSSLCPLHQHSPEGSAETLPPTATGIPYTRLLKGSTHCSPPQSLLKRGSLRLPPELLMERVGEGPENMHFH